VRRSDFLAEVVSVDGSLICYAESGVKYIELTKQLIYCLSKMLSPSYVVKYMARKVALIYLRPYSDAAGEALFWKGVSLQDVIDVSPDSGGYLLWKKKQWVDAGKKMLDFPVGRATLFDSMWFCLFHSNGISLA